MGIMPRDFVVRERPPEDALQLARAVVTGAVPLSVLDELLGAEAAIQNACQSIRRYIDVAQTFDGREIVFDIAEVATA